MPAVRTLPTAGAARGPRTGLQPRDRRALRDLPSGATGRRRHQGEKPGGGDVMRRSASGASAFTALNAGKRMREIDIARTPGARRCSRRGEADVMVDNYRPGVLARHGLGYEDVKAVNPRIVYCAISGYGYSDPARTPTARTTSDPGADRHDHARRPRASAGQDGLSVIDAARASLARWPSSPRCASATQRPAASSTSACGRARCSSCIPSVRNADRRPGDPARRQQGLSGSPAADTFACRDGWLAIGANTPGAHRTPDGCAGVPRLSPLALEPAREDGPLRAGARTTGVSRTPSRPPCPSTPRRNSSGN